MSLETTLTRAGGFMALHGSGLDGVFVGTLQRERDASGLLQALAERQQEDGGLPPWRGEGAADEASTARSLRRLDALGLLDHPVPEAAVAFLTARQAPDGGFGAGLDEETRVARTGEVVGLLAKTPFGRPSVIEAGERFLEALWSVDRVQAGACAPIEAYVHALAHAHAELADEALQWCGRELERGFRQTAFSALEVARVFLCARARALPGCKVDATELVTGLVTDQQEDGGWPGEGAEGRLDATLDAMEALLRLG